MDGEQQVAAVGRVLVDPKCDLTQRFRALFTLRNLGGETSVCCLHTFLWQVCCKSRQCCHWRQSRQITFQYICRTFILEFTSAHLRPPCNGIIERQLGIFTKCYSEFKYTVVVFFKEPSEFSQTEREFVFVFFVWKILIITMIVRNK